MSDPVSNAEVEDVLSSIRRLVSEEKRSPVAVEQSGGNDRLVLTPALRVAEDTRPVASEDDETVQEAEADQPEEVAAQMEPEAHEPVGFHETVVEDQADDADDLHELNDTPEDKHADAEPEQADASKPDAPDVLVLVPDVVAEQDEPEHHDAEYDPPKQDEVVSEDAGPDEFVTENAPQDEVVDIPVAEPVDVIEEISSATTFSAKIAALETVIGRTDDQWEPDDTGDSDYSGTEAPAMSWEDSDAVGETVEAASENDVFASAEDFLDEDALRDLVSDIVREELQGALGERITRNVRKLVRREIHRALAAQELE
jgi:hypothetical protein